MENPFYKNLNIINILEILLEFLLDKPLEVNKEYSALREFTLSGCASRRQRSVPVPRKGLTKYSRDNNIERFKKILHGIAVKEELR
jgi:hypothetical protein